MKATTDSPRAEPDHLGQGALASEQQDTVEGDGPAQSG